MTKKLSRRDALKVGALGVLGGLAACSPAARATEAIIPTLSPFPTITAAPTATPVPGVTPTAGPTVSTLIQDIAAQATRYLDSLDEAQRTRTSYAFDDPELTRWHWTTPGNFPRNGLPLRKMGTDQRDAAFALLQTSQSAFGLQKSLDIISLQNDLGNDPELYYVTVFGTPGVEPWGWRWEGHHLSRQFTIVGEQVAMMPFFLGSWPTTTEAGLRAMASEEDAALELINSFTGSAREAAIFQEAPLTNHVTQNAAQVTPLEPIGVPYTDMTGAQQGLVTDVPAYEAGGVGYVGAPGRQIIEHDDAVAGIQKLERHVAADVARTTGDKRAHAVDPIGVVLGPTRPHFPRARRMR